MRSRKPTETNTVLAPCLQLLDILQKQDKLRYWRANAGAAMRGKRLIRMAPAGTPDILCVIPQRRDNLLPASLLGRLYGIECKMPGRRRSAAQVAWAASMAQVGVEVWVVEDVKQLEAYLIELGVM